MASNFSPTWLNGVPKLNGSNYHDWKFAVELVMKQAGCWEVAFGTTAKPATHTRGSGDDYDKKAEQALYIIGMTIDVGQYPYIRDVSGAEAWSALKAVYEQNSRANRISLKHAFYGFRHDVQKPIREYINGITGLATQLKSIGVQPDANDISDVLIWNLDPSYANIAGALAAAKTLTVADISGALMEEESRRGIAPGADPANSAMAARANFNRYSKTDENRSPPICYVCGRRGHIARDCEHRADEPRNMANVLTDPDNVALSAYMVTGSDYETEEMIYM